MVVRVHGEDVIEAVKVSPFRLPRPLPGKVNAALPGRRVAALSGPNLSREIADGLPGATVIASPDADLEALMSNRRRTVDVPILYHLEHVQVSCGSNEIPTATVQLTTPDGSSVTDAAIGTGPVDAVYKAINRIVQVPNELTEFRVDSVTEGIDALGDVTIRIGRDDKTYVGRGSDTDIIVASAKAYMNALNRLIAMEQLETAPVDSPTT